jgi:Holliday junction resolvasome RuvABC endonuclease subunit
MKIKVISIDPSMSNTGIVWATVDLVTDEVEIVSTVLVSTEKGKSKGVRASSDTVKRCRELTAAIAQALEFNPQVCFAETPSGSQSSDGMKSYGISCTLIALLEPEAVQVTPDEVKKASVGTKTATKEQMREWAYEKHPDAGWIEFRGKRTNANEHVADAIAAIYAGIRTADFQRLKKVMLVRT